MEDYKPPFHMTARIVSLLADVSEEIGRIAVLSRGLLTPHLRKGNRIRTIHSSLAIEQNSLSLAQVTAILEGKRILGAPNEIREVQNAYEAYEMLLTLDPYSVSDLLAAHKRMMRGLISENGVFRTGGVGVFNGKQMVHMAPPAMLVPGEIENLFEWYRTSDMHPLIRSAAFHYEFEFIHPFADGNGRMGRFWHTLLLGAWKEVFYWLPIEDLIRERQKQYYAALAASDHTADCAPFVELMLEIILDTLRQTSVVGEVSKVNDEVNEKVNDEVNDEAGDGGSDGESALLQLLAEDPHCTVTRAAERLGVSRKTIAARLKSLKEKDRIVRIGSSRAGYWKVLRK